MENKIGACAIVIFTIVDIIVLFADSSCAS